jgi:hypothetical protein
MLLHLTPCSSAPRRGLLCRSSLTCLPPPRSPSRADRKQCTFAANPLFASPPSFSDPASTPSTHRAVSGSPGKQQQQGQGRPVAAAAPAAPAAERTSPGDKGAKAGRWWGRNSSRIAQEPQATAPSAPSAGADIAAAGAAAAAAAAGAAKSAGTPGATARQLQFNKLEAAAAAAALAPAPAPSANWAMLLTAPRPSSAPADRWIWQVAAAAAAEQAASQGARDAVLRRVLEVPQLGCCAGAVAVLGVDFRPVATPPEGASARECASWLEDLMPLMAAAGDALPSFAADPPVEGLPSHGPSNDSAAPQVVLVCEAGCEAHAAAAAIAHLLCHRRMSMYEAMVTASKWGLDLHLSQEGQLGLEQLAARAM